MTYIDAHCHLADPCFDGKLDQVMAHARQVKIHHFIQGGVGPEDWQRQMQLADASWLFSFGLHPWFVAEHSDSACKQALSQLEPLLKQAIALGECGIDRGPKVSKASYPRQVTCFEDQLRMAKEHDKPLVLHVVRAHGEVLKRLRACKSQWRGIVHGFAGSYDVARAYMDLGLVISVGGALTRLGYHKLKSAVSRIPKTHLVVESDAPDMAPTDWGHPLNEPASLWLVAKAVAYFQQSNAKDVLDRSRQNLCRVFNLEL